MSLSQNVKVSTLVTAVIASLAIGRISTSTWRAAIATLHLVTAAVSTSTAWNTPAIARHLTVTLRSHARSTLSGIVPVATTCWAWCSHRRVLARISRHGTSRVWSTLRRHGLGAAVLREAICRRSLGVARSLRLLRGIAIELTGWRTVFAPLSGTLAVTFTR